jgi:hypothetical protein
MDELSDLFASVDAAQIADDVMEYGVIAASAIASGVAFNMGVGYLLSKWTTAPAWVSQYVVPASAIVLGAVGGSYVAAKYNRRVGTGMAVGLATVGLTQLAKQFFPSLPLQGLGYGPEDEALLGLGNGQQAFQRYLAASGQQLSGATVTVEDVSGGNGFSGFGNATMTVEQVSGLGNVAAAFA